MPTNAFQCGSRFSREKTEPSWLRAKRLWMAVEFRRDIRRKAGRSIARVAWACLWLIASLGLHSALAQSADETAVKAVFLLRFGSFVDWPPSAFEAASSPLVICVAGDAGLAKTVEQAAQGEHVASRPIVAKRIDGDLPKEGCHVVYAGGSGAHNTAEILEHFRGMPVLTVTDADYGTARGIIHFVLSDRRVRFRIDRSEAERNGLRMNARLLQIALSVDVSDARSGP